MVTRRMISLPTEMLLVEQLYHLVVTDHTGTLGMPDVLFCLACLIIMALSVPMVQPKCCPFGLWTPTRISVRLTTERCY